MAQRLTAAALHPELRRYRLFPNPPIRSRWLLKVMQSASGVRLPNVPGGMRHRFVALGDGAGTHIYTPPGDRTRAALLWIHGGGMVVGSAAQDHGRCFSLARELDIVVVSVEYRLAPRHPYPAPLDDCHAAWRWSLAHADELGVDAARIAVGGQSAGGGLAAGLVQRIHDEGGAQPVAQWLFCPMLDDRTAADRQLDDVRHYLWNNVSNRVGWSSYLGTEPGGPDVPSYAAPARRTDLRHLPPAWIGTGDVELFYAENRLYAEQLTAAGVCCVLNTVQGGPHAFESLAANTNVSRQYLEDATTWLAERLAVSG